MKLRITEVTALERGPINFDDGGSIDGRARIVWRVIVSQPVPAMSDVIINPTDGHITIVFADEPKNSKGEPIRPGDTIELAAFVVG